MDPSEIESPRTELVIHRRDARFMERMVPFLKEGGCAVLVGSAQFFSDFPALQPADLFCPGTLPRRCASALPSAGRGGVQGISLARMSRIVAFTSSSEAWEMSIPPVLR